MTSGAPLAIALPALLLAACGGGSTTPPPDGGAGAGGHSTSADAGRAGADGGAARLDLVPIPGGHFVMGDHNGFVDPAHPSDEGPLHPVTLIGFQMARTETTCAQFLPYLTAALAAGEIRVEGTQLVAAADGAPYLDTADAPAPSCITWDGSQLGVTPGREQFPISAVRWLAAAAYCNWYGAELGLPPCYTLPGGATDWTRTCVRLPTEAEWEYAGRGGLADPYRAYPWGDEVDGARVNWVGSGDPWEQGDAPQLTPAGFFDGSVRHKADFAWPGAVESYETHDGRNGYGLADMAGNVWEWVNDWYGRDYYAKSPAQDPPGPAAGDPMPDGQPYRGMRGGSFFNRTVSEGDHERVSNRDPAYFRGKYLGQDDPDGPWFHIGFRVVLQQR